MIKFERPVERPANPRFSSGPCPKPPGWKLESLNPAALGRSHRSSIGRNRLRQVIQLTQELLKIPKDYRIGIMPGSDTGAVEIALWSLLGPKPVEVLAWESFGSDWFQDVAQQLNLNTKVQYAEYGYLPDLSKIDFSSDVVFTWNGTTSGVRVPNGEFIPNDRIGLTICDATSAVFAVDLPWEKLDATTFSWQKVLGGEAAHGMLVLSPRAVERLESWTPPWPLPKLFSLTKAGKLNESIFDGSTINTPSMLCVEDCIMSLKWVRAIGGLEGMIARADNNAKTLNTLVEKVEWLEHLAKLPETRSNTSVCLTLNNPAIPFDEMHAFASRITKRLQMEGVAFDIGSYRSAPAGLRIWCGSTVENSDLIALLPWIEWGYKYEYAAI